MNFKKTLLILFIFNTLYLHSQVSYSGKIQDEKGVSVGAAIIRVLNNTLGAQTDINGNFKIQFSTAGEYSIQIKCINYETITKQISLKEGENKVESILLKTTPVSKKEIVIKGTKSKESETAILLEQKNAVLIEEKVGAQEMSKKGSSDAAAAVSKIAGISKTDGGDNGSIFVRGLGDRYNSTTLNGLVLPSENPELKNISLNFFPSDIIQSVSVSKTYNRNVLGDFGGAGINISTKEFNGKPFIQLGLSSGVNTQAISNTIYSSGMNSWGTASNKEISTTSLSNYGFSNVQWSPIARKGLNLNNGANITFGTSKKQDKYTIGFFGNLSYALTNLYKNGMSANAAAGGFYNQFYDHAITSGIEVNKDALLNLYLKTIKGNEFKLNYILVNNNSNLVKTLYGINTDIDPENKAFITRSIQEQNTLHVFQTLNKIALSKNSKLIIDASYNTVKSNQPQRITNILVDSANTNTYRISSNASANNNLYWHKNIENQIASNIGIELNLGKENNLEERPIKLFLGGNILIKNKTFSSYQVNFKPSYAPYGLYNPYTLDQFFNSTEYSKNNFSIQTGSKQKDGEITPFTYNGNLKIYSGIIDITYKSTPKTTLFGGIKIDAISQSVEWDVSPTAAKTPVGKKVRSFVKPLPYLNFKYEITEKTNLKGGISKTYTLPQFKELAPFLYENITSNSYGNPYVYSSDNYNADIKYEYFPSKTELLSATGFFKYIANPINKILAPNSANEMTYVNTGNYALVTGVELEAKKSLDKLFDLKETNKLTTGLNLSYIYSKQELSNTKVSSENKGWVSGNFTNKTASLQGASPFILNADISYQKKFKNYEPTITAVVNYFSDRLTSIGTFGIGNSYDKGFVTLDVITKHMFSQKIEAGLNFKNILNPMIDTYQKVEHKDNVLVNRYQLGTNISLSISYKFSK